MVNLNDILLTVQRPGRYIGGEWNSVRKEWTPDRVKVALAFPDIYEIGMSCLGMKILYGVLNGLDDCLCERVFSPWADFEEVLRRNNMPLFSLESRSPLRDFDIVGFSLSYELSYTNVLNILDLGGIGLRSSERTDDEPIIIAGGALCCNPEPMAPFIDAFLIGDGEEAICEIVEAYRRQRKNTGASRPDVLRALASIEGIYVPSFYQTRYHSDRTIKSFTPLVKDAMPVVRKRVVKNLDGAFYPTVQIVPFLQVVHDRISIEIMRGCKHACRFCQAYSTYRPCRERSKETILKLAKESYENTGYDEISLLSLSSGGHSQIKEIIEGLSALFKGKAVSISLPSLRVEDVLAKLPTLISQVKKSGLTFAPEAGSERLRRAMNKDINIAGLIRAVKESYLSGWNRIKLYFMIGLPAEIREDLIGIVDLCSRVSLVKKGLDGAAGHVRAAINSFIPKPHTPFQWEAMDDMDKLAEKQSILKYASRSQANGARIQIDLHSIEMSRLEAVFARGDRRLADAIYEAWSGGCRFDGWGDCFDYGRWLRAFERTGIDQAFYANRKREFTEVMPWDFIDVGVRKERLWDLRQI